EQGVRLDIRLRRQSGQEQYQGEQGNETSMHGGSPTNHEGEMGRIQGIVTAERRRCTRFLAACDVAFLLLRRTRHAGRRFTSPWEKPAREEEPDPDADEGTTADQLLEDIAGHGREYVARDYGVAKDRLSGITSDEELARAIFSILGRSGPYAAPRWTSATGPPRER